ncbi:hypothetical protein [Priestia aryabhattai]
MNIEKTAELLDEKSKLEELDQKYTHYIEQVEVLENVIRLILNQTTTWESGNGSESHAQRIEEFFKRYGQETAKLDSLSIELTSSIKGIDVLINDQMNKGPKW